MCRLLLCDLVGEPATRASLMTLREDIAELIDRLEDSEATAQALPHRSKYLLLVNEFQRATCSSTSSLSTRSSAISQQMSEARIVRPLSRARSSNEAADAGGPLDRRGPERATSRGGNLRR